MKAAKTDVYSSALTREAFLFHEMRITAKIMTSGCTDKEIIETIAAENLFQFPTEKTITKVANACIRRLNVMDDPLLVEAIATQPSDVSKQICLYAMMKQSRLAREFMTTVIGEKYRLMDTSFGKIEINSFFMRLQEQNDVVAGWSTGTIAKLKQVLIKTLVETEYLDNVKSEYLNTVWLQPILENAIRSKGEEYLLPAFNCFS